MTPPARSAGGFRRSSESDVEPRLPIERMKPLGLGLEQAAASPS